MRSLPHVEQLTPEGEHPIVVSTDHAQPADRQGLGRISLGQDEGALGRVLSSRVVGVVQLGDAFQLGVLGGVALLVQLALSYMKLRKFVDVNHKACSLKPHCTT